MFTATNKPNTLTIRSMTRADLSKALEVVESSIDKNPDGFRKNPKESNEAFMLRLMRLREQKLGDCLVGEVDGNIIAVGGLDPHGMQKRNPKGKRPEIARVHVAEEYHGKGIGYAMLLTLIDLAKLRGYWKTLLHVTKTQDSAIRLYDGLGFAVVEDKVYEVMDAPEHEAGDGKIKAFPTLSYQLKLKDKRHSLQVVEMVQRDFPLKDDNKIDRAALPAEKPGSIVRILGHIVGYEGRVKPAISSEEKRKKDYRHKANSDNSLAVRM
jgi:ribosomal protein S18 acetylase RimI-like enzyme